MCSLKNIYSNYDSYFAALVYHATNSKRTTAIFCDFWKTKMFNPNNLQFHLNNALQRIHQLESGFKWK